MDILLRPEQPLDYSETEHITREAFWNHYSPGCNEHYLLHLLRNHPTFMLDIVAAYDGKIVGIVSSQRSSCRYPNATTI